MASDNHRCNHSTNARQWFYNFFPVYPPYHDHEKSYFHQSQSIDHVVAEQTGKNCQIEVNAGETKVDFIELKVKDLQDDVQEKEIITNNELKINNENSTTLRIKNIVKQAEVKVTLTCFLGFKKRMAVYV